MMAPTGFRVPICPRHRVKTSGGAEEPDFVLSAAIDGSDSIVVHSRMGPVLRDLRRGLLGMNEESGHGECRGG